VLALRVEQLLQADQLLAIGVELLARLLLIAILAGIARIHIAQAKLLAWLHPMPFVQR